MACMKLASGWRSPRLHRLPVEGDGAVDACERPPAAAAHVARQLGLRAPRIFVGCRASTRAASRRRGRRAQSRAFLSESPHPSHWNHTILHGEDDALLVRARE